MNPPAPDESRSEDDRPCEHPGDRASLARALARARAATPFQELLEELLRELTPADADALMLRIKESRATWTLLSGARGGRALFVGDPLSGSVAALAFLGFDVCVADADATRGAFSALRGGTLGAGRTFAAVAAPDRLPFRADSFDLVVAELGGGLACDAGVLGELARVARGDLAVVVDNRLAYKRSTGRRGTFHVPGPFEWLARAALPVGGERTLAGYRSRLGAHRPRLRSFALYPDARDFSHVVALDAPRPRLTVGPKERQNRLKLAARAAGLFRHLTPSFALLGRRGDAAAPRLERVLAALGERLGEATPEVDVLVATRSNVGLVLTAPRGREAGGGEGCWAIHVPLGPHKARMVRRHFAFLERVRREFSAIPVPDPLFVGELEGLLVSCERRLPGLSAPQITGDRARTARMYGDLRRAFAGLALGPPDPFDEESFERLVADRFRLVARKCAVPATARRIDRAIDAARERLVGLSFPLVLYHADLRSKHVQVDEEGRVLGLLDWGASESEFLPYVDLAHLVGHQRKQEADVSPAEAWRVLRDRAYADHEREFLDGYAEDLALPSELVRVVEELHPLFVAGMAERNWDYSRPRWVSSQFGF